jgi:1-acyl-sn-glycerol-3-phosphate acyltransferase
MVVGLGALGLGTTVFALVCLVLLPSRRWRIAACNVFGHVMGPVLLRVTGVTVNQDVPGKLAAVFPAIYVSNHTSIIDMFIAIWACPLFTCGVAKKEIVYYPFFGQLYAISGHLMVDRGDTRSALAGMRALGELVKCSGLGIWIWAEGTRSRDGRLLPLKQGFAQLALATGLPIVPVVVKGAHKGWEKGTLCFDPVTISVEVLPTVSTATWTADNLYDRMAEVHDLVNNALPADQRGRPMETGRVERINARKQARAAAAAARALPTAGPGPQEHAPVTAP